MRKALFTVIVVAAAVVLWSRVAMADTILDPQIFIGPPGSNSPPGGTAVGGESNLLVGTSSGTGFSLGVAGNHTMQDPMLVIFGAAPGSVLSPTLGFSGCPTVTGCGIAPLGTYGITGNNNVVFNTSDAYSVLGVTANASESFTNWQTADSLNGFGTPSQYLLDVFSVPATVTGMQGISLSEKGLAAGSFIIAYSCEVPDPNLAACSGGQVGATPFTNAGLVTVTSGGGPPPPPPPPPPVNVPEPAALPVAGLVLGALVAAWRTRKSA
jgi:hypothetical protein